MAAQAPGFHLDPLLAEGRSHPREIPFQDATPIVGLIGHEKNSFIRNYVLILDVFTVSVK
jgi:hypothetical protein